MTGAARGAAEIRVVRASFENERWQSQELVHVELPPGGFVVLKPAAGIIIAASANRGMAKTQRIRWFTLSDIFFIDYTTRASGKSKTTQLRSQQLANWK